MTNRGGEEINPTQRGISVDVLAERLSNHTDAMRSEFQALHHHFAALETKVDAYGEDVQGVKKDVQGVRTALHDHEAQQHHIGTRDRLLELSKTLLENERKFGEIDKVFAGIETARVVEKAAVEARTRQRNQGLTAVDKTIGLLLLMAPIVITLAKG